MLQRKKFRGSLFINNISSRGVVYIVLGGGGPNVAVK